MKIYVLHLTTEDMKLFWWVDLAFILTLKGAQDGETAEMSATGNE